MTPAELTAIRARDASWTESIANSNYVRGPESSLPYDSGSQCIGDRRALLADYDALAASLAIQDEANDILMRRVGEWATCLRATGRPNIADEMDRLLGKPPFDYSAAERSGESK